MTEHERGQPMRLDTIINWAREGIAIAGEVQLTESHIIEKIHTEAGETDDVDSYLLTGVFSFRVDDERFTVAKTYLKGYRSEPLDVAAANHRIANARLKMDYERIQGAGISLAEKYFDERRIS